MKDVGLDAAMGFGNVKTLVIVNIVPIINTSKFKLDRLKFTFACYIFMSQRSLEIIAVTELELNILDLHCVGGKYPTIRYPYTFLP